MLFNIIIGGYMNKQMKDCTCQYLEMQKLKSENEKEGDI